MQEQEAIALLREGNIGGLETLVAMYQERALRAAFLITRDRALAEDVVQAAFLRAYDRIEQFDTTRPFAPWFLRSVVNDAIKRASRDQRSVPLEEESAGRTASTSTGDPAGDPAELLAGAETRDEIRKALAALTPKQRAAVVLRYYLDLSETEMVDQLRWPRGRVKWHLHAARTRLRALLKAERSAKPDAYVEHEESLS